MSYRVEIPPATQKEIRVLPGHVRGQVRELLRELEREPRPPRAKELRDKSNIYRIWLATRWRLVYEIDDHVQTITLLRVRLKEDIDYESI